jgi:integrase
MQRFLEPHELRRLAHALDKELDEYGVLFPVTAIRLLALTGRRRGEIVCLRWRDVDLARGLPAC